MPARPVEWVLVVFYGPSAHRATYGRQVVSDKYSKDYIQLTRKQEFLDATTKLFAADTNVEADVPLTYRWPTGEAQGSFVFKSADRPHLKWVTSKGAPPVWKMSLTPSETTDETIPGDPSHREFEAAENELSLLSGRGAGQPYLVAIKLRDESRALHLRAYLADPSEEFTWANILLCPPDIQVLAKKTHKGSALAWAVFQSGGRRPTPVVSAALRGLTEAGETALDEVEEDTGPALLSYLRDPGYGLFFDPAKNHDAWSVPESLPERVDESLDALIETLATRFPNDTAGDATAEALDISPEELEVFRNQIYNRNFEVPDSLSTTKTRGSAQRAFANAVKGNYEYRCAITGIGNKDFLVAAHIVPWSEDQRIRLDPSNGICLSLLVDRAFEKGYLLINDDLTIDVDRDKIGDDEQLRIQLEPFVGKKIRAPKVEEPRPEYLQRRRALIAAADEH